MLDSFVPVFSLFLSLIISVIWATFRRQKSFGDISGTNSNRKTSRKRRFCLATSLSFCGTLVFALEPVLQCCRLFSFHQFLLNKVSLGGKYSWSNIKYVIPSPTITVVLELAASTKELIPLEAGVLEIDLICRMAFSTICRKKYSCYTDDMLGITIRY